MIQTLALQADIQPDRRLSISLPHDVPIGPAEVVVVIASRQPISRRQGLPRPRWRTRRCLAYGPTGLTRVTI